MNPEQIAEMRKRHAAQPMSMMTSRMASASDDVRRALDALEAERAKTAKLAEALVAARYTMERMAYYAFERGLEGTKHWDDVAGRAGLHSAIDKADDALTAQEQSQ